MAYMQFFSSFRGLSINMSVFSVVFFSDLKLLFFSFLTLLRLGVNFVFRWTTQSWRRCRMKGHVLVYILSHIRPLNSSWRLWKIFLKLNLTIFCRLILLRLSVNFVFRGSVQSWRRHQMKGHVLVSILSHIRPLNLSWLLKKMGLKFVTAIFFQKTFGFWRLTKSPTATVPVLV